MKTATRPNITTDHELRAEGWEPLGVLIGFPRPINIIDTAQCGDSMSSDRCHPRRGFTCLRLGEASWMSGIAANRATCGW